MRRFLIATLVLLMLWNATALARVAADSTKAETYVVSYAIYDGDCDAGQAPLIKSGQLVYANSVSAERISQDLALAANRAFGSQQRVPRERSASASASHVHNDYLDYSTRVHENEGGSQCKTYTVKTYGCLVQGCDWTTDIVSSVAYHTKNSSTCKNWKPPL